MPTVAPPIVGPPSGGRIQVQLQRQFLKSLISPSGRYCSWLNEMTYRHVGTDIFFYTAFPPEKRDVSHFGHRDTIRRRHELAPIGSQTFRGVRSGIGGKERGGMG